jgi:hypothetical protein
MRTTITISGRILFGSAVSALWLLAACGSSGEDAPTMQPTGNSGSTGLPGGGTGGTVQGGGGTAGTTVGGGAAGDVGVGGGAGGAATAALAVHPPRAQVVQQAAVRALAGAAVSWCPR